MTRLIDADYLLKELEDWQADLDDAMSGRQLGVTDAIVITCQMPTVDAVPVRHGKWTEKHHAYSEEESAIEEWQSCRCSECGRYDTRPYMYYFDEPNYCSYCGAMMKGKGDERNR